MPGMSKLMKSSRQAVAYMIREITRICRDMGKRAPGSEGERKAGACMARVLETECGLAEVRVEAFREHPDAFYGYFWFSALFDCLCAAMYNDQQWLGIASGVVALLLFLFQVVLYKQVIDPLFP